MKGLNALEIIFTLFVLIVVVLVVVRVFISRFSFAGIEEPIQDITETYNFEAAYSTCNSLCSKYESDCGNLQNAVRFCLEEVKIDIDGDRIPGEKGHYNVVEGTPLCEDGIYCFHIKTDCTCGSLRLTPKSCKDILCDYYIEHMNYPEETAAEMIQKGINYGTCEPDVREWDIKIRKYIPRVPPYNSDWKDDIDYMGPDYWWATSNYTTPCGVTLFAGAIEFSCKKYGSDEIECTWSGVPSDQSAFIAFCTENYCGEGGELILEYLRSVESNSGSIIVEVEPGTYYIILQGKGPAIKSPPVTI